MDTPVHPVRSPLPWFGEVKSSLSDPGDVSRRSVFNFIYEGWDLNNRTQSWRYGDRKGSVESSPTSSFHFPHPPEPLGFRPCTMVPPPPPLGGVHGGSLKMFLPKTTTGGRVVLLVHTTKSFGLLRRS